MSWGAVAGAAVGVVGGMMSDKGGGGGGGGGQTATQSKEPWAALQPWMMNNAVSGQRLQSQYEAQPFNAQQQGAYQNQANQGAYMRAAVPNLLRQMQGQQVGFDRSNPNVRPTAFNWDGLLSAAKAGENSMGLLDQLSNSGAVNSSLDRMAEPEPEKKGEFRQETIPWSDVQKQLMESGRSPWMLGSNTMLGSVGDGGYGEFTYGMEPPKPGTQAYRDMQEYFAYGGTDHLAKYGKRNLGADFMWGDPSAELPRELSGGA